MFSTVDRKAWLALVQTAMRNLRTKGSECASALCLMSQERGQMAEAKRETNR